MITPSLILESLGKADNIRGEFCLGHSSLADKVTSYTFYSILASALSFLLLFKILL
jgi:hypothetical protein